MSADLRTGVGMRRAGLGLLVLAAFLSGIWVAAELPAQNPRSGKPKQRVEEEEEPAKTDPKPAPAGDRRGKPRVEEEEPTVPRKVRRVDEDDTPDDSSGAVAGDLRQAAAQEKNVVAKVLFQTLAVPHDRVLYKYISRVVSERGQKEETIEPYPEYAGEGAKDLSEPIKFQPVDLREGKPLKEHSATRSSIASIQPYEELALGKVRAFLKEKLSDYPRDENPPRYLSRYQQLQKAEQALSAVLRFHESARQRQARRGQAWDKVQSDLRQLLLEVMLEELRSLQASQDWDGLFTLTRRLMGIYTQVEQRKQIAAPLAEEINRVLTSGSPLISEERKRDALQRLHYLEEHVPDSSAVSGLSERMQKKAQAYLDQARQLIKAGPENLSAAQRLLTQARETWPGLPGLNAYMTELSQKHPVLRVGVRQLPQFLSPARAWTDNEVRVVEMLFEGLVKQSPDGTGLLRYRPALAEELPRIVSLGREFQLARNARWSQKQALYAGDVRYSVRQLRECQVTGRWLAQGEMFEDVELRGHANQVTLRLRHGFLDPLALMTFKIVPPGSNPDSKEFAQNPLGSGPYKYEGRSSEDGREYLRFIANPYYGIRPSKQGKPSMQEIRLFLYSDALAELRNGHLDLVLDMTANEAAAIGKQAAALRVRVPLPGATTLNRRVYFLAVNQRKAPLDNPKVRQALAYAINREVLLDNHYRGDLKRAVHKALNGPFPVSSWARDPKVTNPQDSNSLDLFDPALAAARSKEVGDQLRTAGELTLKYPEDDPVLKDTLAELVEQVRRSTGMTVRLSPRSPHGLREDVEVTQSYDLAYYHYDYPDETYWLRPLLGPNVPERGENYLGFHGGDLATLLDEMRGRRYFPEVQRHLQQAHKPFLNDMPLIPLWQLDPLFALHEEVQAPPFDPQLVFTDVEMWRLQR